MESRDRATEFEKATTSIFADIFGLYAEHIGQKGIVPDVVVVSREEGLVWHLGQQSICQGIRVSDMTTVTVWSSTSNGTRSMALICDARSSLYVVSDYKNSVTPQIRTISEKSGVPGR